MPDYPPGGVIFPNDRKANDRAPDFTGIIDIDQALCSEIADQLRANPRAKLEVAGWRKSKNGKEFVSLRLQPPYGRRSAPPQQQGQPQQSPAPSISDDDIPF